MKYPSASKFAKILYAIAAIFGGYLFALVLFVTVMNADIHSRLIETIAVPGIDNSDKSSLELPTVRLILHRLPADENSVEVSVLLSVEGGVLADLIRKNKAWLTASVRDGSTYQPFALKHEVTLDAITANPTPGVFPLAVQSQRFFLPILPSSGGFPFDDLVIFPIVLVFRESGYTRQFRLEIQKAIPGRLIKLRDDKNIQIGLTRSPTEKALVVTGSLVFLFLSGVLVLRLFAARQSSTTLQELLAIGGFIMAAAGFRALLGISRTTGASALEVAVIGFPLLLLTFGLAVSLVRGRFEVRREIIHDQNGHKVTEDRSSEDRSSQNHKSPSG